MAPILCARPEMAEESLKHFCGFGVRSTRLRGRNLRKGSRLLLPRCELELKLAKLELNTPVQSHRLSI